MDKSQVLLLGSLRNSEFLLIYFIRKIYVYDIELQKLLTVRPLFSSGSDF